MSHFVLATLLCFFLSIGLNGADALRSVPEVTSSNGRIGVNMVDLMWEYVGLGKRTVAETDASLKAACSRGFTTVRFAVSAFWPKELNETYLQRPDWYADRFQTLVQKADSYRCKLIPSLVWNHFAFADALGEPLGEAMRNPESKTRKHVAEFIHRIVTKANSSKAGGVIEAWELGNELNLLVDLDMETHCSACAPAMGTPNHRTRKDNFSTSDMVAYETWMSDRIQSVLHHAGEEEEEGRVSLPVSHGHAIPRAQAYHLMQSYHSLRRDWTSDTQAQFGQILTLQSQCCDYVSFHFYPGSSFNRRWCNGVNSTVPIAVAQQLVSQIPSVGHNSVANKTLYVGEFGNEHPGPRTFSFSVLAALKANHVPKATIWIWEFYQVSSKRMSLFSIEPGRDNNIIHAMEALNKIPVGDEDEGEFVTTNKV